MEVGDKVAEKKKKNLMKMLKYNERKRRGYK